MTDKEVVDFSSAREKVINKRKADKEKALEKQFKKAMGWKKTRPRKKPPGSKGPKPRGRK